MKFKTTIGKLKNNVYYEHILVPKKKHDAIVTGKNKRVIVTVNSEEPFHAGLMPKGDGDYFIIINKARMKAFKLKPGMEISVVLEKDTSKYGMPMPAEFQEILDTDEEGRVLFEELTDGKKRNLIHMINSTKNSDLRITKALIMMDHLKANKGKLDFKLLNEALKVKNRKY